MPEDVGLGPLTLASLWAQLLRRRRGKGGECCQGTVLSQRLPRGYKRPRLVAAPLQLPPTKSSDVTNPKALRGSFIKFF